jgi:hypothetical protein
MDPIEYLVTASRNLDEYRAATNNARHGMNDLKLFEMIGNITMDGDYPSVASAADVMRKALEDRWAVDFDVNGYEWEWWVEQAHDMLEHFGHKRVDEEAS